MPLAQRSRLLLAVASAVAAISTCSSPKELLAFDKQTCATAYETAQQLRNELKLRSARAQLLICGHSSCPTVVTKDCNSWLTQVDAALASVVFRVRDERGQLLTDVRVVLDGVLLQDKIDGAAVMVDPGLHTFRFESNNFAPAEQKQMLAKGQRDRPIEVRLKPLTEDTTARADVAPSETPKEEPKPPERDAPKPAESKGGPGVGTYVAGGIGLVALSSFAYFGLSGNAAANDMQSSCKPNCSEEEVSAARTKLIAANVSLGVGIAAVGVAAILWAAQGSSSPKTGSSMGHPATRFVGVDVLPLGNGAQVVTTFTSP